MSLFVWSETTRTNNTGNEVPDEVDEAIDKSLDRNSALESLHLESLWFICRWLHPSVICFMNNREEPCDWRDAERKRDWNQKGWGRKNDGWRRKAEGADERGAGPPRNASNQGPERKSSRFVFLSNPFFCWPHWFLQSQSFCGFLPVVKPTACHPPSPRCPQRGGSPTPMSRVAGKRESCQINVDVISKALESVGKTPKLDLSGQWQKRKSFLWWASFHSFNRSTYWERCYQALQCTEKVKWCDWTWVEQFVSSMNSCFPYVLFIIAMFLFRRFYWFWRYNCAFVYSAINAYPQFFISWRFEKWKQFSFLVEPPCINLFSTGNNLGIQEMIRLSNALRSMPSLTCLDLHGSFLFIRRRGIEIKMSWWKQETTLETREFRFFPNWSLKVKHSKNWTLDVSHLYQATNGWCSLLFVVTANKIGAMGARALQNLLGAGVPLQELNLSGLHLFPQSIKNGACFHMVMNSQVMLYMMTVCWAFAVLWWTIVSFVFLTLMVNTWSSGTSGFVLKSCFSCK